MNETITINGVTYKRIDNTTHSKVAALRRNLAAFDISDESECLKTTAVSGASIRYIRNPSEAVQLAAVGAWGDAIQYIHDPSEAVQLAAVGEDGYAIRYIHDPSEAVQLAAVGENCYAIKYIHDPSEAVLQYVYDNSTLLDQT